MITNELISEIKSKINDNHKQAVTGGILQGVLVDMVKSLCEVYPQTYTDEEKAQARANIDALSNHNGEITKEKLSLEVQAILNDVANKQNISDATLATIAKTIVGAINEVYKGGLEDASIATSKIKDGAITDAKIANGAVTTPKIANDAVTTEKVNDGAITEPKLDTDLVNVITSAVQPEELASAIATALASYVAKEDIVDTTGSATDKVMSQHGVTEAIDGVTNKVTELESKNREFSNSIQDLDGDNLYITDKDGYVIAKINSDGIESIEVKAGDKRLSEHISDIKQDLYQSELYVTDGNGYVIAKIDKTGISCIRIDANNLLQNQWNKKNIATYGDSVTALNGGNYSYPYSTAATAAKWGGKVAKYFNFANIYNRGIGSTTFNYYNTQGGQVAWCRTNTGEYVDRNDSYNYDNYEGQVTIPSDCTPIRGCGSSWLRITTMFPESIKDTIDVVLVMFHNDFHQDMDTECAWVEGSNYDKEWKASEYYKDYGGDYNIETVRGGIASTYMKLQAWMPQALIVLMSPISGVYVNGNDGVKDLENPESAKMKKLAETVKDIAFRLSVPFIDVYGTDCINSLNKKLRNYITDGIHPYSDAGCKVIARAIISGLQSIVPFLND